MKYPCCFCLYDNYDKDKYNKSEWPNEFIVGHYNVINVPLVNAENFIFPTLHIKLGLWKQFIKYMPKDCEAFSVITSVFPK